MAKSGKTPLKHIKTAMNIIGYLPYIYHTFTIAGYRKKPDFLHQHGLGMFWRWFFMTRLQSMSCSGASTGYHLQCCQGWASRMAVLMSISFKKRLTGWLSHQVNGEFFFSAVFLFLTLSFANVEIQMNFPPNNEVPQEICATRTMVRWDRWI